MGLFDVFKKKKSLEFRAPISGAVVPLDQVPDPVFARKMVGDGISIDPLGNLLVSPVAGEVVDVQPSAHAITVRSDDGLEIEFEGLQGFAEEARQRW